MRVQGAERSTAPDMVAGSLDQAHLVDLLKQLLTELSASAGHDSKPATQVLDRQTTAPVGTSDTVTTPAQNAPGQPGTAGTDVTSAPSVTAAGDGPNRIEITNTQDHAITIGKFKNGESTVDPSASITLQPGQTGTIRYGNGEAGFVAQADASGTFQPNASRLEYEADADGKMKYPDVSYIDGRNASISLTDDANLQMGDAKSIADGAPAGTVTTDAAGNKTIAGWYDGSSTEMQAGGAYMVEQLGTGGAYLHPNDDTLGAGQNPMSATQSTVLKASFGDA